METAPNAHSIPMPVSQPSAGVPHTSEEENPVVAVAVELELEVPTVMTPSAVGQVRRSATQILPNLFLSDALTARWGGTLDRLKITHIISVLEEPITFPSTERPLKLLHITASDDSNTDLLSFMDQTTEFIKEAIGTNKRDQGQLDLTSLSATSATAAAETTIDGESPMSSGPARAQENTVLVHCLAGMSRSATIVIAYLIATTPMTVGEATEFVRSKRKIIRPNHGFVKQLEQYERRHFVSTGKTAAVKKRVGTDIASRIQMYQDVAAGVRRNEE